MSVFTTDFSEYTTGVDLSDWSDDLGDGASFEATAASDPLQVGTKEVVIDPITENKQAITWDAVGDVADSDIYAKINVGQGLITASDYVSVASRMSGSGGVLTDNYFAIIGSNYFQINKTVNGTAAAIIYESFDPTHYEYYWVRFQTIGTSLKAKIWAEDAIEPAEWALSTTDSDLASGKVGIVTAGSTVPIKVDYFSCGVGTSSPIFPPEDYNLLTKFGSVGRFSVSSGGIIARAMGGMIVDADKQLTGISVSHNGFTTGSIRVAVYSGGVLSTGLNNATLLHDFGEIQAMASPVTASCSPIDIPIDEPLWLIIKAPVSFVNKYEDYPVNSGNYQQDRGRADYTALLGTDVTVAFPDTFPDTNGTFGNYWYEWSIVLQDEPTEPTVQTASPVITPTSGEYPGTQLITITLG